MPLERAYFEFPDELKKFRAALQTPDFPTIDESSMFSQIFDAAATNRHSEIDSAASLMGHGEGLFENASLRGEDKERIYRASYDLGMAINQRLHHMRCFDDGDFPYVFKRFINHDTVMLIPTPSFSR